MAAVAPSYKGFRYPAEIISHCVWLYHRFPLSFREVEEMMMERGIVVTYETIRQWCRKFGQTYAKQRRHPQRPCQQQEEDQQQLAPMPRRRLTMTIIWQDSG